MTPAPGDEHSGLPSSSYQFATHRSSARPPSCSGAKSTSSATSSTTCRSASARGSRAIVRRAYQASDVTTATRLLTELAKRLEDEYPSAAGSVPREGLDETLTVLTLHLSTRLQRSLATTNAAESLLSRTRHVKRNVKRWRGGQMMLRWVAAGILEAVKGFRRLKGRDAGQRAGTQLTCSLGNLVRYKLTAEISTNCGPNK